MLDTLLNVVLIGLLFLIPIALLAAATYVLIRPLEDMEEQRTESTPIEPKSDATSVPKGRPVEHAAKTRRPA